MKLLKELREERGVTQIEMAQNLGMSYQNYRNYDSGKYKFMTADLENKVSSLLGISFMYVNKEEYDKSKEGK